MKSIKWLQSQIEEHKKVFGTNPLDKEFMDFVELHKQEQETLYTEEQIRKAYYQGAADVHDKCTIRTWRGVETKVDIELLKKLNAEYIQSLKQPKKD